jgi:DNA repair protein RecN (Recombination protein N)
MTGELIFSNIGGITDARIALEGRFIAVTGESGAGKSSIVRALELLTGVRSSASILRAGTEQAEVFYSFDSARMAPQFHEKEPILVRRIISASGKNRTYVQDRPVTLSSLERLMEPHIRIQSQFAQMRLLDPDDQMAILDASGGEALAKLKGALLSYWTDAISKERLLRDIQKKRKEIENTYSSADKILPALRSLSLTPECDREWETLRLELQERVHAMRRVSEHFLRLTGGKSEPGILDELEQTLSALQSVLPENLAHELAIAADEGVSRIRQSLHALENLFGPRELDVAETALEDHEKRLGLYRKTLRQAGLSSSGELIEYSRRAQSELSWLSSSHAEVESLQNEILKLKKEASRTALALRDARRLIASGLQRKVTETLRELAMSGTLFRIDIEPQERIRSTGADIVSFLFSPDGERFLPVQRVASGGELSRLLLALQVAMPEELLPETLVFDEVEAGLGGQAALLTGLRLRELSRSCRILLVTHEATLASLADQHFLVEREGAESLIREVRGDERVREIARMLSGDPDLKEAQDHARRILRGEHLMN